MHFCTHLLVFITLAVSYGDPIEGGGTHNLLPVNAKRVVRLREEALIDKAAIAAHENPQLPPAGLEGELDAENEPDKSDVFDSDNPNDWPPVPPSSSEGDGRNRKLDILVVVVSISGATMLAIILLFIFRAECMNIYCMALMG